VLEGDQERIRLLQEWFGYCLTPDTSQHKFLVLEGEGANGKSVTLEILTSLVGQENTSNVPLEAFADRFALGSTLGKLLNVCTEVGQIDSVAEATLKSFTAGERRSIDRKHISAVDAYITARLVLATNNRPRFKDGSSGIWRRMLLMPFRVMIPESRQDKRLTDKLRRELPGIFLWAVEGQRRLQEQGLFTQPAICAEALNDYRLESNPARVFLTEHYEKSADGVVISAAIFDEYRSWARLQAVGELRETDVGREVARAFPERRRERITIGGVRHWVYRGIQRCPDAPSVPEVVIAEAV
jgi:P4 family phage/plasmid primase-like protien